MPSRGHALHVALMKQAMTGYSRWPLMSPLSRALTLRLRWTQIWTVRRWTRMTSCSLTLLAMTWQWMLLQYMGLQRQCMGFQRQWMLLQWMLLQGMAVVLPVSSSWAQVLRSILMTLGVFLI